MVLLAGNTSLDPKILEEIHKGRETAFNKTTTNQKLDSSKQTLNHYYLPRNLFFMSFHIVLHVKNIKFFMFKTF